MDDDLLAGERRFYRLQVPDIRLEALDSLDLAAVEGGHLVTPRVLQAAPEDAADETAHACYEDSLHGPDTPSPARAPPRG